jgi:hypothetical protein
MIKLILLTLLVLVGGWTSAQENPDKVAESGTGDASFDSLMGAPWGISAKSFLRDFKYGNRIKQIPDRAKVGSIAAFELTDFNLGIAMIHKVIFHFAHHGTKPHEFVKQDFDRVFLRSAGFMISSSDYEILVEVLVKKYGKPFSRGLEEIQNSTASNFFQKTTVWINRSQTRSITAYKYSTRMLYRHDDWEQAEGWIEFEPLDNMPASEQEKAKTAAAEKL